MFGEMVDILWLSRYDYKPGWSLYPHDHPHHQLIYIMGGEGVFRYGDHERGIRPGDNFLIRAHQEHSLANTSDKTLKTLDIKFYIYDQELLSCLDEMEPELCVFSTETESQWNRIKEESQAKSMFYKEMGRLALTELLFTLIRSGTPGWQGMESESAVEVVPEDNGVIQKFMEFIQENYHRDLSLDSIAEGICYNKSYLCQVFRKHYKSTPMRFLYDLRVRRAKDLIRTSDYNLKEIALMTGFNSIHHFCRTFTNAAGMSPGSYRDSEKRGIYRDICVNEDFQNILYIAGESETEESEGVQIG